MRSWYLISRGAWWGIGDEMPISKIAISRAVIMIQCIIFTDIFVDEFDFSFPSPFQTYLHGLMSS